MSFWSHYCVSPGYWMLVPAHLAMWTGGLWLRRNYTGASVPALGRLAAGVVVATALCHLFAQGGFYWLSDSVAGPTFAGWAMNYGDWFRSDERRGGKECVSTFISRRSTSHYKQKSSP